MLLDSVNKSIEIYLGAAKTTNDCPVTAFYVDHVAAGGTPGSSDNTTNGTTAITAVAAPAVGTRRQVKMITVYNADTVNTVVLIRLNNGGVHRILGQFTTLPGETLVYQNEIGFTINPAMSEITIMGDATLANQTLILADTNELQTDWHDGGRLDLIVDDIETDVDDIETDTNELQTDWHDGGRLDLLIDGIKAKTDTIVAGGDATIANQNLILADIGDASAATLGSLLGILGDPATTITAQITGVKSETALIVADTGELQTDLHDGGRLDLLIDAIKAKTDNLPADPADDSDIDAQLATIVADTGELQTDLHDGGRIDLLIDAIKAKTDTIVAGGDATAANQVLILADTATIIADTDELQTDWHDGGRLDLILDDIETDVDDIETDTNELQTDLHDGGRLDLLIDGIKAKTDNIVAAGATEAKQDTIIGYLNTEIADILADTGELQTDWHDGGRLDLILDDVETDVDDIETDTNELQADWHDGGRLDLLIDGIKAKTDVIVAGGATEANVDAVETKVDTIDGIVDAIKLKTDNIGATVALEAGGNIASILADTGELQTDWVNGGRLDLLIDAIKAKTDNLPADPADDSDIDTQLAAIVADTGELQTDWVNGGRLDLLIDAIKAKTDNLPADPADDSDIDTQLGTIVADTGELQTDWVNGGRLDLLIDGIKASTDRSARYQHKDIFWSAPQISVTVTTGDTDLTLPSVVLPNITGTIIHAYAGFKFRMLSNSNAAANKLDAAQEIQVKENAAGAWTDCINFVDDQFGVAASTREGGDVCMGNIDVVAQVAAFNKTYAFQWDEADCDQNNLIFWDVQTFLIITWY